MTAAAPVLSLVDTCTGELHLVPVEMVALHRRSGRYPALCGTEVPAASLTTPPARRCLDCAQQAQERDGCGPLQRKPVRPHSVRIPWLSRRGRHRDRRT